MSATDEELEFVHEQEMDHVTYILIMFRYLRISNFLRTHLMSNLCQRRILLVCIHRVPYPSLLHYWP